MIQLSASRLSLGPARPTNLRDGVGSVATREPACAFALPAPRPPLYAALSARAEHRRRRCRRNPPLREGRGIEDCSSGSAAQAAGACGLPSASPLAGPSVSYIPIERSGHQRGASANHPTAPAVCRFSSTSNILLLKLFWHMCCTKGFPRWNVFH